MSCTRAIGTNSGLIDNFVSGEIGIVDTLGIMAIENEEYCCIFGELSGGGGAEVPALAIPRGSARKHFHTDAPTGRRCESAFALLSHKKVTKRLWLAASYGKIGVVGYRLL